jgi:hypothetical protein
MSMQRLVMLCLLALFGLAEYGVVRGVARSNPEWGMLLAGFLISCANGIVPAAVSLLAKKFEVRSL